MMAETTLCVDSQAELTAQWLTEALHSTGHDARVRGVRSERIGTGQIGASYRLHLDLEGVSDVPPTLVAKIGAGAPESRERVKHGFEKEVRFYQHLAPLTSVSTPRCWFAGISDDLRSFTLLLEDLAPRVPGRQVDGCTALRAASAVDNLAALHAPLWQSPRLHQHADWLAPTDAAGGDFLGAIMVSATNQFVDRYSNRLSAQDQLTLLEAAAVIGRWAGSPADVFTVIHGDYRLDNLMFDPGTGSVAAVDWQTATTGPPARDLAYFLSTSLTIEHRREQEQSLIADYVAGLAKRGVDYALHQAVADYRVSMLQGPLITVLGCMYATAVRSADADDMFLAMATRSCAAIRDLDTLEAVGSSEAQINRI